MTSKNFEAEGMAAMEPVKKHSIAIEGFDGQTEIVQADELRVCVPTKACIQFWATIIACFVCIALGVFFMIYQGTTSAYYSVGLAMIGLGTGVLIPGNVLLFSPFFADARLLGPNYGSVAPKKDA